eukprot:CAMPEP_0119048400 /NCGR_PEP_ID=MMETSP1177-20130426/58666_1 /TAXON_ID=2985 /ORGANISM="Ochromonas sp, Strain CCMP1899" /LENGTH=754 /DNA_ID=CAMNT_0007024213 /DNA_START=117 /DNA_END=2381 /DNA_ORIENTATION=+
MARKSSSRHFIARATLSRTLSTVPKIIYTQTDEAPALATFSFLPIVRTFGAKVGIQVEKVDISLSARIIAQFPKYLTEDQKMGDTLVELGQLCKTAEANIIKLPNVSASVPQLNAAIAELRLKGYDVPVYVSNPTTEKEKVINQRYSKVLGSAVNPVLREGNSDRRVAAPVKNYAKKNPHVLGMWSKASRSHVAHMTKGDFFASEQSSVVAKDGSVKIEHIATDGTVTVLKESIPLLKDEIIDAAFMNVTELREFYEREMQDAHKENMLLSLHLKATMMKISDPIMFGHAVTVFFKDVFTKNADTLKELGVNADYGLNDLLEKIKFLPEITKMGIEADIAEVYERRPWLAMVNSDKGITNLNVPSDVIVDASMPNVVRDSGKMWNRDNELEDVKCLIPDRCYAKIYQEVMSFCKQHGQFDVATMGNVANVGLMAQKAEEYGSHDKTFKIKSSGIVKVTGDGKVIFEHAVGEGDIWRMCQTKDIAIKDWVKLAVSRARATGVPTVFWLDEGRAHDRNLISKVKIYLKDHDTKDLNIQIMNPDNAMRYSCERARDGLDTISVTGNVLRDYLTDLFPIIELGTSAKMLSIVPLLAGGGMFETGAGGSAPKHVDQFLKEGHLRWDSLGEYLAVAVSLEHLGETTKNERAVNLSKSLNQAIERLLENRKSPGRKVNQLDNRASNFYVSLYWAEFMAAVDPDFQTLATSLKENREKIVGELKACQGKSVDVGGYYKIDNKLAEAVMRPSPTQNKILDGKM